MKKNICVCDVESDYSYQLMETVNARKTGPFFIKAFTTPETLLSHLREEETEILLISPAFYTREIESLEVPYVFFLTEGISATEDTRPSINKYQKSDDLIRAVLKGYDQSDDSFPRNADQPAELIGIYSPLHRIGKTSFALALGQEIARKRRTLYLNLESCSGFSDLIGDESDIDLSDLLYYARQDGGLLSRQIAAATRTLQSLDYIPPARISADLMEITAEEWNYLLDQLEKGGVYESIVIDFGEGPQGLLGLLARCGKIYTPVVSDMISQGKIRHYEHMLESLDYSEVMDRTEKITLPMTDCLREHSAYMGEMLWGPLSGYARSLILSEEAGAV